VHKESLDGDRIFVIHDFLATDECDAFIANSEHAGFDQATITTITGATLDKEVRDNARLIVDDPSLAEKLWRRAQPFLPSELDDAKVAGLNERFRFYRYDAGQRFAPHFDGYFRRADNERSYLTFMVYLNDEFTGGEPKFYSNDRILRTTVHPARGMALVFAHLQLHEGASIISGRKYVLRTDVMYALSAEAPA
jgi:prolyl 4-hydroxylase